MGKNEGIERSENFEANLRDVLASDTKQNLSKVLLDIRDSQSRAQIVELIEYFVEKGNYKKVIDILMKYSEFAFDKKYIIQISSMMLDDGDIDGALKTIDKFIEIEGKTTIYELEEMKEYAKKIENEMTRCYLLGMIARREISDNRLIDALSTVDLMGLIKFDQERSKVLVLIIEKYLKINDIENAELVLQKITELEFMTIGTVMIAEYYIKNSKQEKARDILKQLGNYCISMCGQITESAELKKILKGLKR